MRKLFLFAIFIGILILIINKVNVGSTGKIENILPGILNGGTSTPFPTLNEKILINDYHIFQTFNNCGPASLSMALSYYGINVSQKELGDLLRPYQNPQGDNDDKSVTLEELAIKARDYGLIPYHRPNGNIDTIQRAISAGFPVITRTALKADDDIGHFRVIKGYDQNKLIQDDSLQGHNLSYEYEEFSNIWGKFNYEFLILIPKDKNQLAESILQENLDENKSWQLASNRAEASLNRDQYDIYAGFNYSVALYHTKNYKKAIEEFEKIENLLPFRTLWYQIEPINAYYELGEYEKVFKLTDKILNNQNRAFSELYIIRGDIYKNEGKLEQANKEYDLARFYNKNLEI